MGEPTYNGAKMILFGGISTELLSTLGSIWILDVLSLSWKKGVNIDPLQNRTGMACTVAGDNFIVWGGNNNRNTPLQPMVIYNLKTDQWTNQFAIPIPPPHSTGTSNVTPISSTSASTPTSTPSTSGGSSGTNVVAIGSSICAVLAVAMIGFFIYYRRRNRRRAVPQFTKSDDSVGRLGDNREVNDFNMTAYHHSHPYQENGSEPEDVGNPYVENVRDLYSPSGPGHRFDGDTSDRWSSTQTAISPPLTNTYPSYYPNYPQSPEPSERTLSRTASPIPRPLIGAKLRNDDDYNYGFPGYYPNNPQVEHDQENDINVKVLRPPTFLSKDQIQRGPQYRPTETSAPSDRRVNNPQYQSVVNQEPSSSEHVEQGYESEQYNLMYQAAEAPLRPRRYPQERKNNPQYRSAQIAQQRQIQGSEQRHDDRYEYHIPPPFPPPPSIPKKP
ncbi:hypothetical protein BGX28_008306 [Mortierella sp. GBA30]|nr:hypothetical protein BGX28_008306 [Mortierella sp. GBA30]